MREVRKRCGLAVDGLGGVDVGQREGQGLEPVDETGGQLVAVTDPAGGQVLLVDLVEEPVDGPPHQAAPRELVDADGDVEAGVVLRAGGVRGAGRQVHGEARPEQHVVDPAVSRVVPVVAGPLAAGVVHLPLLGAVGLEDEHVVAVAVHREALRARAA